MTGQSPTTAALVVYDADAQMALAERYQKSGVWPDLKSPQMAFAKIAAGAELGLPPFQSLQAIHFLPNGRPSVDVHTMSRMIKTSGKYDYKVLESTRERCAIEFWERSHLTGGQWRAVGIEEFTKKQADEIQVYEGRDEGGKAQLKPLAQKSVYKSWLPDMLYARAMSKGARKYCPDAIGGVFVAHGSGEIPADYVSDDPDPQDGAGTAAQLFPDAPPTPGMAHLQEAVGPLEPTQSRQDVTPPGPTPSGDPTPEESVLLSQLFEGISPRTWLPFPDTDHPEDETEVLWSNALIGPNSHGTMLRTCLLWAATDGQAVEREQVRALTRAQRQQAAAILEYLVVQLRAHGVPKGKTVRQLREWLKLSADTLRAMRRPPERGATEEAAHA